MLKKKSVVGVWSNKDKNKCLEDEKMRKKQKKKEKMREMSVEWRMGERRRLQRAMDG